MKQNYLNKHSVVFLPFGGNEFHLKPYYLTAISCIIVLFISQIPLLHSQELNKQSIGLLDKEVIIKLEKYAELFEGDIVPCSITGSPKSVYWTIDNQSIHTYFYNTNPVLFDPEPTPLKKEYVNLSVFAEYQDHISFDSIPVKIHRLYFGDLHFHSTFSDGYNPADTLYENAINDNYVDYVCLTDHAEIVNSLDFTPPQPLWMFSRSLVQYLSYIFTDYDEWELIKSKAIEYYTPGSFTTFLGFEYSPGPWYPGGFPWSTDGHEDISHVNFYYKDVYPDAPEFSAHNTHTWHDIFAKMYDEYQKGHLSFCFPHHPLATFGFWGAYTVNWTYLADNVDGQQTKTLLRGAEVYSKWGQAIGKYSDIPMTWTYSPSNTFDLPQYWVENGLWEWSSPEKINQRFMMIASSDNHATDRPASASMNSRISSSHPNPAGIIATYAVHNTRSEIWDAINQCDSYGLQLLKIRANARFDDQLAYGKWINCTTPLQINITALSTFNATDHGGKSMCPHAYSSDELEHPIEDIWVVKKDTNKGQPWCKIIAHVQPQTNLAVFTFEDDTVQPYDFYYIVIKQKGQYLENGSDPDQDRDEYLSFIGPVFINNVT